jgi:uncharacterized membrane protein (DUF373 family)
MNNNGKTIIDVLVFLKKISELVVITIDIIIKNKIKPMAPYLEKKDTFSIAFAVFKLLEIFGNVNNTIK